MNSTRFKKDSVQFKKESALCDLAARTAEFLESSAPADSYDFALSDLLYFSSEEVLEQLRENTTWQALEAEFMAIGGIVAEDWEDDETPVSTEQSVKVLRPVSRWKSRAIALMLIFIVPAIVGGTLGWLYPYKLLPKVNCSVVMN
jgi:hypothetical protein